MKSEKKKGSARSSAKSRNRNTSTAGNPIDEEKITESRKHSKLSYFENILTERNVLIFVMLLGLALMLLVPGSRYLGGENASPGDFSYYHQRISEYERDSFPKLFIFAKDNLLFGGRTYYANPYHLLMGVLGTMVPFAILFKIVPLVLSLCSLLLFYIIMRKLGVSLLRRFVVCSLLVSSPVFIYLFAFPAPSSLAVLILLASFYLFIQDNWTKYLFFPAALMIPFFGMFPSIFMILVLLYYSMTKNDKYTRKMFFLASTLIFVSSVFMYLPYLRITSNYDFIVLNPVEQFISDLGGIVGFGIFNLLLMIFASLIIWEKKQRHYLVIFILMLLAFMFSFYIDPSINIYLNFIVAMLAGYGLIQLLKLKWTVPLVKSLTIIIVLCGLTFSSLSYINRVSSMPPEKVDIAALDFLVDYNANKKINSGINNDADNPVVFSHYATSFLIQDHGFATVTDSLFSTYPALSRLNDSDTIFQSRKLDDTKRLLDKYNISYILITDEMKQGLVWTKQEQGLLFLLENAPDHFTKIYDSGKVEIWEYSGEGRAAEVSRAEVRAAGGEK